MKEVIYTNEVSLKTLVLDFQYWVKYLFKKKYVILIVIIVGVVLGKIYAYYQDDMYKATTTFVLENDNSAKSQMSGLASSFGFDVGNTSTGVFQGDNIIALYQSRKMIETALLSIPDSTSMLTLADKYVDVFKVREEWEEEGRSYKDKNFYGEAISGRMRDSLLGRFCSNIKAEVLNVRRANKSGIIQISVQSPNESFSKEFNDALVRNVSAVYMQMKNQKGVKSIEILTTKVDSVQALLDRSIVRTSSAVDDTPNLNPTRSSQREIPIQRSQLSIESNRAILSRLVQNLEAAKLDLLKESPLIQIIDEPIYPLSRERVKNMKIMIYAGILACFAICVVLILIKSYKNLMKREEDI